MKNLRTWNREIRLALLLITVLAQVATALAQDAEEASSSPAGLAMLVLFLGIAGMIGVLVIRWSQTTGDEEE